MRRIILSSVLTLALIPTLSVANPLESLARFVAVPQQCDIHQANFCQCFEDSAVYYCSSTHRAVGHCSKRVIWSGIYTAGRLDGFCNKWHTKFPKDLTHEKCVEHVGYAKEHCQGRG